MIAVFFFASFLTALNPFHSDDRVATASLVFEVVDDRGKPVEDATIDVFFDMLYEKGTSLSANTDSNGVSRVKGKTIGMIAYRAQKKGYYPAQGKIILIEQGREHEMRNGKWQPWDMQQTISLPKIRKPVAVRSQKYGWRTTKKCGVWLGFDLQKYDFVSPYGSGTDADFEIKFNWDGKTFREYNGMATDIRFVEPHAGVYWSAKIENSDMKGIYSANPQADYLKTISFSERIVRDERGALRSREQNLFDESKVLVGRSRCVVDEHGDLKSAVYFQILHMSFSCDNDGVGLRCAFYYNPTPNDTNIEPKM